MENFEKCTVAMLGGQCSQHVTGNTSQLNRPQSAIIETWSCQSHEKVEETLVHPSYIYSENVFTFLYWAHKQVPGSQSIAIFSH